MTHVDVLIVGAGISGIGAACHLQMESPDRTCVILEGRDDIGGTWDLFRYPGVRSDSDMHTLGFAFKPWTAEKSIADGPSIMAYLRETVDEYGLDRFIRFGHLVRTAEWDSGTARWTITAERRADGEQVQFTANFLFMCSGYYSYKEGYTPSFPGIDQYTGTVVHPQAWPDDLDTSGKKVVVIGSGATAMTLVPALAGTAAHVTMLKRTPTYVAAGPDRDVVANTLRKVLPDRTAYEITRWKNVRMQQWIYRRTRTQPEKVKQMLLTRVRKALPEGYDVERHFTPPYNPWDQRLCLVPNGDLFAAISRGDASVVTDHIDSFTPTGIRLRSGEELEADIVVTATGLNLVMLGEVHIVVDGEPVDFSHTWSYKGFAYSDVPNVRVHQRVVDAARRPDLQLRVPTAEPHARHGHAAVHASPPRRRRRHARTAVDPGLLGRLHGTRDGPVPEAGRPSAVDQPTGLRPRQEAVRRGPRGRRGDAVQSVFVMAPVSAPCTSLAYLPSTPVV